MAKKKTSKMHALDSAFTMKTSPWSLRQIEKARSVEVRKVQRAAKARAKAIGSVWDDEA